MDLVLVTSDGCKVLTSYPYSLAQTPSSTTAKPWPTPMHNVATP